MTRVDFYILEKPSQRQHALFICRLTDKVWRQGHQIHIHCPDSAEAQSIDGLLWTFDDTSFVPHAPHSSADQACAPVLIGFGDAIPNATDVLINLHPDVPDYFSQFDRVIETTGKDEESRGAARSRYRFYQQRGYALKTHNINPRHG